tara:strand:- start:32596 stop:33270 length:675 start_codon:yes stop_codon:yes gene_type:complete
MLNLDTSNKALLGIFFLYLVILSGEGSGRLLNCKVQKIVNDNILIQHVLVFLSIFLFTFILNWFTPSSLVLTHEISPSPEQESFVNKSGKYTYVLSSLKNSFIIYLIFLFSTKLTPLSQTIFFVLMLLLFFLFIFYKIELEALSITEKDVDKWYISKNYLNQLVNGKDTTLLYILHNIMSLGYFTTVINLVIGIILYYKKQRKEHAKDWDVIKFIFGVEKCDSM